MLASLSLLVLGFLLGMRHATDPDHVVAISTIASRERTLRGAAAIGGLWGVGHALPVLAVGSAYILLELVLPPRVVLALELGVAVMLVLLGVLSLTRPARAWAHHRARPVVVGFVHGLAGSAAAAIIVLAAVSDTRWAVGALLLFCAGTIAGMMLVTAAIALPSRWASARFAGAQRYLVLASAVASVGFGLFLAHQVGVVEGLFAAPAP
jgi:high-affinity nickel-transport protein